MAETFSILISLLNYIPNYIFAKKLLVHLVILIKNIIWLNTVLGNSKNKIEGVPFKKHVFI